MKQQSEHLSETLTIEEMVVQQISRDGEFHLYSRVKCGITLLCALLFLSAGVFAQPVLVSGFTGMAAVNGATYVKTGVAGNPTGGYAFVAASNDRMKFYATWFSNHHLYFIDPNTYAVTDSMGGDYYTLSASNEPNTLFSRSNTGMYRINTVSKTITDSLNIANAFNLAERPNSKEVWVGANNKIEVVNYASGLVSAPFTYSNVNTDNGDIKFTKGGSIAYKLAWTSFKVYKINATTKAILDSASCTSSPSNIVVSGDSSKIFVSFPNEKRIRIYQTSTMDIVDSINCGTREPFDLYSHPDKTELWVVNHFKDTVTVFNEATYAQIATIPVTGSPHSIAFGVGSAGVNNADQNVVVTAYPNPVSNTLTVSGLSVNDRVLAYDMTGRELFLLMATGTQQTFDISALKAGMYMIQVLDAHGARKASLHVTKL